MAIRVIHSPDANLVGQAANQAGLGQYHQQREKFGLDIARFGENQRQFGLTHDLRRDQFAESQEQFDETFAERQRQADIENQLRYAQFSESQQQFDARMRDAQRARLAQAQREQLRSSSGLAEQQMQLEAQQQLQNERLQAGLLGNQIAADNRLQLEQLQQAGLSQRGQQTLQGQMQRQQDQLLARQAQADWTTIQERLPYLSPADQADLVGQFEEKYAGMGTQMPMTAVGNYEQPPTPEEQRMQIEQQKFEFEQQKMAAEIEQKNQLAYQQAVEKERQAEAKARFDEQERISKLRSSYFDDRHKAYEAARKAAITKQGATGSVVMNEGIYNKILQEEMSRIEDEYGQYGFSQGFQGDDASLPIARTPEDAASLAATGKRFIYKGQIVQRRPSPSGGQRSIAPIAQF